MFYMMLILYTLIFGIPVVPYEPIIDVEPELDNILDIDQYNISMVNLYTLFVLYKFTIDMLY